MEHRHDIAIDLYVVAIPDACERADGRHTELDGAEECPAVAHVRKLAPVNAQMNEKEIFLMAVHETPSTQASKLGQKLASQRPRTRLMSHPQFLRRMLRFAAGAFDCWAAATV